MTIRSLARLALAGSAFAFLATSAMADGIGASLLTQQHPFYIELADAMKAEATAKDVKLEVAIANQDLNKQLADVEDFIVKGVDAARLSAKGYGAARPVAANDSDTNKARNRRIEVIVRP